MNPVLDRLATMLRRQPLTARQVAERLSISRPTAYEWIRALAERGESVYQIPARQTGPGPRAKAYGIR